MALPTVTRFIHEAVATNYPGKSISQVERMHGKKKNYITQWCEADASITLPPVHDTIYALARLLKVSAGDMWLAFWRDCAEYNESPLYEVAKSEPARTGLSTGEQNIIDRWNATDPALRPLLGRVLDLFVPSDGPAPDLSLLHMQATAADTGSGAVAQVQPRDQANAEQPSRDAIRRHPDALAG